MQRSEIYEVTVPINAPAPARARGLHVFTGRATSADEALIRAHQAYATAVTAANAPAVREPDGWSACGIREGWDLDWPSAKATPWTPPRSSTPTGYRP
ncbi:hypothetical protein ACFY9C_35060 [Streptomyces filamentosus]|uniref:hypothetical protein n=1 Tax=Streptomyces filamentosus TaxID=67294 RepID=UPI0036EECD0B